MDRIEIVEGEVVLVMELADMNLYDVYEDAKAAGLIGIPRETLIGYIRDSAEALDYMCERHGLQHLDIKPKNLFLVGDRVKVADFGLVKHLERSGGSGILCGITPLYASPEAFVGKISNRSDQYSLAVVYQELLTSQRPFQGRSAREVAQKHMQGEADLRSLPEAERPIVSRALSKDPENRFPNCMAFVKALYNAYYPGRITLSTEEDNPNRPRSMVDTMEDVLLGLDQKEIPRAIPLTPTPSPAPVSPSAYLPAEQFHPDEMVDLGDISDPDSYDGSDPRRPSFFSQRADVLSDLGVTACHPQTGALRPTLLIGAGGIGRRVLMEIRCRILDRFGDLRRAPIFRFLYVDPDGDAVKQSMRGDPEIALDTSEVYHLSLQPMSHYRRRQLDHLFEWLSREKLYACLAL